MTYTIDQVQALYFKTKDEADALSKRHAEEMAPFTKKLDVLKAWMLDFLNTTRQDSARTEHGTCFKATATSVSVEDWEQVVGFVLQGVIETIADRMEAGADEADAIAAGKAVGRWTFFNRAVNKTAVMEHLEQHKILVPGVKMTSVVQVNTRRA